MPPVDPEPPVKEIVIEFAGDAAAAAWRSTLGRAFLAAGVPVRPLHPGSTDPDLTRLAVTSVPAHLVDSVLARLLDSPDVDTAYVKPGGQPP